MISTHSSLVLAGLSLALGLAASSPAEQVKFRFKSLLPAGAQSGVATNINAYGHVVGYYINAAGAHVPFVHRNGITEDLPQPSGYTNIIPTDITYGGSRVVGYGTRALAGGGTAPTALTWNFPAGGGVSIAQVMPFGNLSGGKSWFSAVDHTGFAVGAANGADVNGNPTTLMQAMSYNAPSAFKQAHPNLWSANPASSEISDVSSTGLMVGWAVNSAGKTVPVAWNSYGITAIAVPAEATGPARARAIGSRVVGEYFVSASRSKAFYETYEGLTVIPRLPGASGDDSNAAVDVNEFDRVIGTCEIGNGNYHGFISKFGEVHSLAAKTLGLRSGNTIPKVGGINSASQIAATMRSGTKETPTLLTPVQTITCNITLEDFVGNQSDHLIEWEAQKWDGTVLDSGTALMTDQGQCQIETTQIGGFDLVIKASHWLTKKVHYLLDPFQTETFTTTLINGDVDGDNTISIFDYIDLSTSFDKSAGDAGFNAEADLDGDESVTIFDYIILSNNFDQSGE